MKDNKRKNDIDALISNIQGEYKNIENLYNSSLHGKEISSDLKIKIKTKKYSSFNFRNSATFFAATTSSGSLKFPS